MAGVYNSGEMTGKRRGIIVFTGLRRMGAFWE